MPQHETINYVEFPSKDISATKNFFSQVFNWSFTDYGPEYAAFSNADAGLDGGFYQADLHSSAQTGSALIVFYSDNLADTQAKIEQANGTIIKPIYSFPGGQRFHFSEPAGNEFAVWSDQNR